MDTSALRTDVVVVGARCAGAATAMLLARMGHTVTVLERARFPSDTMSTHGITRGGVVQLSRWGLLDAVLAAGAPAVRQACFRSEEGEIVRPIKNRAGVDLLVAPRRHVLDTLLAQAAQNAGAQIQFGTTVTGLLRDPAGRVSGVYGRDPDGDLFRLPARIVIGADGLRSRIAAEVKARVLESYPRDSATFYAYFIGVENRGYEFHVGPAGLAGIFPTNAGQSCVWVCRPASQATALLTAGSRRLDAFIDAVGAQSATLAARLRYGRAASGVRGAVDLPNHVRQAAGPGWALVGDAGYHRDPVTGHGITDAFRDAELLARSLDGFLSGWSSEGAALASYQCQRDTALSEIFALTCELARYPPSARFVELLKQLGRAVEVEAEALAALTTAPPLLMAAAV